MTKTLLLIGAQISLAALGCTQTVSLPEPPQVQAKNHVVSLTLHAVNENGGMHSLSTLTRWLL
jgi:hypothetical protein